MRWCLKEHAGRADAVLARLAAAGSADDLARGGSIADADAGAGAAGGRGLPGPAAAGIRSCQAADRLA
jgi:hypothetical protein